MLKLVWATVELAGGPGLEVIEPGAGPCTYPRKERVAF